MFSEKLVEKWRLLERSKIEANYSSLRLSATIIEDIYIGKSKEGLRCLIMSTQNCTQPRRIKKTFSGIHFFYYSNEKIYVVELRDLSFADIFDDLIISVYHALEFEKNSDNASIIFVDQVLRWARLFAPIPTHKMPEEEIQGLFGELVFLNHLINEKKEITANQILNGWKGPFGGLRDYYYSDIEYEVKTCTITSRVVKIANERQLESEKKINLIIIMIDRSSEECSLKTKILEIIELLRANSADLSTFYLALAQKGIGMNNIDDFSWWSCSPIKIEYYECDQRFPAIRKTKMHPALCEVRYSIDLNLLGSSPQREVLL